MWPSSTATGARIVVAFVTGVSGAEAGAVHVNVAVEREIAKPSEATREHFGRVDLVGNFRVNTVSAGSWPRKAKTRPGSGARTSREEGSPRLPLGPGAALQP